MFHFWHSLRRTRLNSPCCLIILVCFNIGLGLICAFLYFGDPALEFYRTFAGGLYAVEKPVDWERCRIPRVNPFNPEIIRYLDKKNITRQIPCQHPVHYIAFAQDPGTRVLRKIRDGQENCYYWPLLRVDDDTTANATNHSFKITEDVTLIPEDHEFIDLMCDKYKNGSITYRDGFSFPPDKPTNFRADKDYLNVIIIGIDGVSRANFIRNAPYSNDYLINKLFAIPMQGYNKVAENTLPNVIPMLTGKTLEEFEQSCIKKQYYSHKKGRKHPKLKNSSKTIHIDDCPFVWKKYKENGFLTAYSKDGGYFPSFKWPNEFKEPPTDYYLRPFSVFMQRHMVFADQECFGPKLSFQVLLNQAANIAKIASNKPHFHFLWTSILAHDRQTDLALGDIPLLEFLKFMEESRYLDNTALFVVSDHGPRMSKHYRVEHQGRLEDRLPLLYAVLPPWFRLSYPVAYMNLKKNSRRITTPFDLYETLVQLTDVSSLHNVAAKSPSSPQVPWSEEISSKPKSLFQAISEKRNCHDAGVPLHWCTCSWTDRKRLSVSSAEVIDAVEFCINQLYKILRTQKLCSRLFLDRILEASSFNFFKNGKEHSALYVMFRTTPGQAVFDATLIRKGNPDDGYGLDWELSEKISRVNEYGTNADCTKNYQEYCYCRRTKGQKNY